MQIQYINDPSKISSQALEGFFVGWSTHPSPKNHLKVLTNSTVCWLAMETDRCVGFVYAISDGFFYSYIPLLEVIPDYQGSGIASELLKRIVQSLDSMYAIDIVCDEALKDFYESRGFTSFHGQAIRNYANQAGPANKGTV
jgi:ribosomal protein S18 acetylase RimI-like enzyme